jgi:hypothetical protein
VKTQLELFPNLPIRRNPATYWARYWAYLKSDKWKEKAEVTKARADYFCEYFGPTCEGWTNLECYHRSYANVFREVPGIDTMCVCRSCHIYIHAHPIIRADNDNVPQADNDNELWDAYYNNSRRR